MFDFRNVEGPAHQRLWEIVTFSDFDGLTMDHLLDRIRTTMPQDNPASLPREQYAAILAFLLKANGFPAGAKALDSRSE